MDPNELDRLCIELVQHFLYERNFPETLACFEKESLVPADPEKFNTFATPLLMELVQQRFAPEAEKPRSSLCDETYFPSGRKPTAAARSFADIHAGNILCVRFVRVGGAVRVVTSSTDRTLKMFAVEVAKEGDVSVVEKLECVWTLKLTSPVLCVDQSPDGKMLVAGCMDGCCLVVGAEDGRLVTREKVHKKYIVTCCYVGEDCFVTGSHDCTLKAFRTTEEGLAMTVDLMFNGCVESVVKLDGAEVVLSVRDDCFLHVVDVEKGLSESRWNINGNKDRHVSFTILNMSLSPDKSLLLAVTDKSTLLVYDLGQNGVIAKRYFGLDNDELSQPRCCWGDRGSYVICTSGDRTIRVFETVSTGMASTLSGHKQVIRDIDYCEELGLLVSVSYDKTLCFWA